MFTNTTLFLFIILTFNYVLISPDPINKSFCSSEFLKKIKILDQEISRLNPTFNKYFHEEKVIPPVNKAFKDEWNELTNSFLTG